MGSAFVEFRRKTQFHLMIFNAKDKDNKNPNLKYKINSEGR